MGSRVPYTFAVHNEDELYSYNINTIIIIYKIGISWVIIDSCRNCSYISEQNSVALIHLVQMSGSF